MSTPAQTVIAEDDRIREEHRVVALPDSLSLGIDDAGLSGASAKSV